MAPLLQFLQLLLFSAVPTTGLSRSFLVTGANKGQGYALCERILEEHDDTHVFLCSRDLARGLAAAQRLASDRVDVVPLDVTSRASIQAAVEQVQKRLGDNKLEGLVSNAGILWGYSLEELLDVCTDGVANVVDAFLPLMNPLGGRIVIVSSGLGPLMNSYSAHQDVLMGSSSWPEVQKLINLVLLVRNTSGKGATALAEIGFPGGPFAESAPDFHTYGLAKMFADSYMLHLARAHPELVINSCDPGLVYTDLIGRMPRYEGMAIEETNGAKTPREGVEVHMRLLFGSSSDVLSSGSFFAMGKDGVLTSGPIDMRPDV